jgi:signal peptidase I
MTNLNWYLSRTVRHATHMRKHVWKILSAQRDLLSVQAIGAVTAALQEMESACAGKVDRKSLQSQMSNLETVANKWLKPYPHAALRENIEVLLVAIAVAMGIRTFIAQPFKIPTGSMQPTLYGVTSNPDFSHYRPADHELRPSPDFEVPNRLKRYFLYWLTGVSYDHVTAGAEGAMQTTHDEPQRFLLFNLKQQFVVGGKTYTVWFPPDKFLQRAGLVDGFGHPNPKVFKLGEDIVKMKSYSGDHLFVDRFTYNFRRPNRGEIIVFETKDITSMRPDQQGQFYIKRLVVLGGEKVRIGNDRHVYINGERLDNSTHHFEKVYSFDPNQPPLESRYSGHINEEVGMREAGRMGLAPLFRNENTIVEVPPGEYMVMGDNTVNSSDSRTWGSFPRGNVIGKALLVYWPFGAQDGRPSRFGFSTR